MVGGGGMVVLVPDNRNYIVNDKENGENLIPDKNERKDE